MNASEKLQLIKQIPYFASVPPAEVEALADSLRERRYRGGDVIFRKGERLSGLCIVLVGRVPTVIASAEGREQVLKVFGPGRTFGDIPVFDDEPLPADAIAMTESTIAVVGKTELLDLLVRHPHAGLDVIRLFATRLRAYKVMIEDLSLREVIVRVARLLRDSALGRAALVEDAASVNLAYTQQELAVMIGSVREVVQRALKTLEHAGLIQMGRGRIRVIDVEGLSMWISSTTPMTHDSRLPAQHHFSHQSDSSR